MRGPRLPESWVLLGRIVGVFGIKGWVKLESDTRPRKAIFDYSPWQLGLSTGWEEIAVKAGEAQGKGLIAKLEGIDDRDAAQALTGVWIAIPREALPAPGTGEVYWTDLVGCRVENLAGIGFGEITGLMETGANDVLVVADHPGQRERLVPYIDDVIIDVDLEHKRVKVDWDENF